MNHTIKGILIVAAITSMLVVGATTVPIMQNSFAHKKERGTSNTNINSADSSSTSAATASNTNNIKNRNEQTQSQAQAACIAVFECPVGSSEGTTPPPPPPPPPVRCPDTVYNDLSGDLCLNGEPTLTCNPLTADQISTSGPDASGKCTGTFKNNSDANRDACLAANGEYDVRTKTCTGYNATQTCPPPGESTQTPTVDPASGRCAIQAEPT